jgi:hypothetical protein
MSETVASNVDIPSSSEPTGATTKKLTQPLTSIQSKMQFQKKPTLNKPSDQNKISHLKENIPEKGICFTPVNYRGGSKLPKLTPSNAKPLFGSSNKKDSSTSKTIATTARGYDALKKTIKSLKNDKLTNLSSSAQTSKDQTPVNKKSYGLHKNDIIYVKTPKSRSVVQKNNFSSASKATPKQQAKEEISFEYNGVDYSETCAKKAEFGYGGPGYIAEYTCHEKYLKGLIVKKGLWKVNSILDYKPDPALVDFGPITFLTRIDMEKKTPLKLTHFDPNFLDQFNVPKSNSQEHLNATSRKMLHLHKVKKPYGVRFADFVEKIDPPKSGLYSSNSSPQINQQSHDYLNLSNDPYNNENSLQLNYSSEKNPKSSLRKSLSMGDINKLALIESDSESSIITDKSLQDHQFMTSSETNIINVTYDKESSSSSSNESSDSGSFKLLLNVKYKVAAQAGTRPCNMPSLAVASSSEAVLAASSPCVPRNSNTSLTIELEEINIKLKQSIDMFLEKPELAHLKEQVLAQNTCSKYLSTIYNNATTCRDNNDVTLTTKSASDALTFLSLNEQMKICLKYFEQNLVIE